MNDAKILELIKEFLQGKFQMVVATYGQHPWIATVYFTYNENLNLYFLSDPETIHCQQIVQNPSVAVAIAEAPQNPPDEKKGLQIYGHAAQVFEKDEITFAIELWRKTLNVMSDDYSYSGMMTNKIKGRMYKITPKKIKFFNTEIWEEGTEPLVEL